MNTTENNKLIADFMEGSVPHYLFKSELKYHTSWDWLMPVVSKINNDMIGRECIIDGLQEVDINVVYKAVVKFIQWYNENQNKDEKYRTNI